VEPYLEKPYRELDGRLRSRSDRLAERLEALQRDARHLAPPRGRRHTALEELGPVLTRVVDETRAELARVQEARARLARDRYGRCDACGESITLERLRLVPETTRCSVCARRHGHEALGWVRREHAGLRFALGALRAGLHALAEAAPVGKAEAGSEPARSPEAGEGDLEVAQRILLVLLADFARQLAAHFEREEAGGYLGEALAVAPRLSPRAERLRREHDSLLRDVERIGRHARFAHPHSAAWDRLEREFRAVAAAIERHEIAESELVSDALLDDVGSVD
jgi:RNA polymerase-binding transcription factor